MNLPTNPAERKVLNDAFRSLRNTHSFQTIMGWITSERDKRDKENRLVGKENLHSESSALSVIIDEANK